ncbi:OmpA family protein [Tenacibaculum mesophilum]|uniref:OmpA family protein n=1 Tax=Tenacibaculum mesophilum TaxID=104268 RepID=UPI0006495F81|nr:OmpA family protein [Tenacibaculum mesophilum]
MKKTILYILMIFSVAGYSQRKYAADRYFKEFAYKKSAELYESLYEKGDDSQLVLGRLADSYYFNIESEKAEKWYTKLMELYEPTVSADHIFRYSQTLKSNGKVEESDKWLLKLKQLVASDSRVKALENNSNYFVDYTNRERTYVNIHNLPINTKYSDFGGFVYKDELYFASTKPSGTKYDKKLYQWNHQPFLNVYTAEENFDDVNKVLQVEKDNKLGAISTRYHESNAIITQDGRTMYFTRDNYNGNSLKGDKKSVTHLKIFRATRIGNTWGDVKELPFNSDAYSCGHPALSADERTLYFVSDMPGGVGGTDLYKVAIEENYNYGAPVNLGATINTESREMFPYLDKENTLYFASDGHIGLGALDVFESKITGNSYGTPVNLGAPINGALDDFAFIIDKSKGRGYFSSNRKGGRGDDDIYSFTIYQCKEDITGVVTDKRTGEPIPDVLVRLMNEEGKEVANQTTKVDGKYVFNQIDCDTPFSLVASKVDYRNVQQATATIDVDKELIVENLQLESLIVEDQIVINPIYFDFDLYNIREDAEYELEHIVTVMKNHPEMIIKIESHTDSRGTLQYNRKLSDNRAKSTREYILSRGISADRIESAIGYGEDQLLNNCDDANQSKCSEEEHQKNRRSYFYIINSGDNIKVDQE